MAEKEAKEEGFPTEQLNLVAGGNIQQAV